MTSYFLLHGVYYFLNKVNMEVNNYNGEVALLKKWSPPILIIISRGGDRSLHPVTPDLRI